LGTTHCHRQLHVVATFYRLPRFSVRSPRQLKQRDEEEVRYTTRNLLIHDGSRKCHKYVRSMMIPIFSSQICIVAYIKFVMNRPMTFYKIHHGLRIMESDLVSMDPPVMLVADVA
jgi:hypothetical protein